MILKEGNVIETDMNKLYQHIIIINIRFSILQILLYIDIKFTKKDYYYYEYNFSLKIKPGWIISSVSSSVSKSSSEEST